MKKYLAGVLTLVMLLGLTACGKGQTIGPGAATPAERQQENTMPEDLWQRAMDDFSARDSMRVNYSMHLVMTSASASEEMSTDMLVDMDGLQGDNLSFGSSGSISSGGEEVPIGMTYLDGVCYMDMGGMKYSYAMPLEDARHYANGYAGEVRPDDMLTNVTNRRVDGGWEVSFSIDSDKVDELLQDVFGDLSAVGGVPVENLMFTRGGVTGYSDISDDGAVRGTGLTFDVGLSDSSAGTLDFKLDLRMLYEYPEDLQVQAPADADAYSRMG